MKINNDKVKDRKNLLATGGQQTNKMSEREERKISLPKKTWRGDDIGIGTTPHGYDN